MAGPGESRKKWECVRCGAPYLAVFVAEADGDTRRNVRLAGGGATTPPTAKRVREALTDRAPVACAAKNAASQGLDRALHQGAPLRVANEGPAFAQKLTKPRADPYDPKVEARLTEGCGESRGHVDSLITAIEQGASIDAGAHRSIARNTLVQATHDLDLFVRLGINPSAESYPGRHSLHVAMLAAGIGATLGWSETTLIDLGVGCLIHDIGMLQVDGGVYQRDKVLSEDEYASVIRHPLHTFDMIEDHLDTVPLASRMVAYQIHERCNGRGYPRNRSAPLIHEAAKVAAVADVYIALVSPRPHRPAMLPYNAIEHLLYRVRDGLFDSASVRALLKTVSLFPIGSFVELSDGRVGRVLRADPADYTRPVLETWRANELDAPAQIVDLARASDVRVNKPLEHLQAA